MAVAFKRYVTGTVNANSQTAAVDLSGCSAGELAFVLIGRPQELDPGGTPDGWTLLDTHTTDYSGGYRCWLYYKTLASGDLGTATWTWSGQYKKTLAVAGVYSGHDSASPVAAYSKGTLIASSGRTLDLGSVSTSEKMVCVFAGCYSTSAKSFDLSSASLTERYDYGTTEPDMWRYIGDTNGAWGGGEFAPSTSTKFIDADAFYRGGFIVAIAAPAAPATGFMTLNRGIW